MLGQALVCSPASPSHAMTKVGRRQLRKMSDTPIARLKIVSVNTDKTCMQNARDRAACWQELFCPVRPVVARRNLRKDREKPLAHLTVLSGIT